MKRLPERSHPLTPQRLFALPFGMCMIGSLLSCAAVGLASCIAPPPKCADSASEESDSGGSASSGKSSSNGPVEAAVAALELVPAETTDNIVWDGENESRGGNNIALINLDPAGSWFVFNDGTPGGVMTPPTTGDFTTAVINGALHTKGTGFKTWGGGVGMNFVGAAMLTPVDATKYRGITFKASGEGWVHVGLATVITLPEFEICKPPSCYDHYMVDVKLSKEPKVYEFTWKQLRQVGFGSPRGKLDPKTVVGLNFTSKGATTWDFTLDDVGFLE
jgi:hypothetical protein